MIVLDKTLTISGTEIIDSFAEAFRMRYARLIVTAADDYWVEAAVREVTGYSSSIISCDCEAGLELQLSPDQTPDGRPGASILLFGFSTEGLQKAVPNRTGQCLMTCPTTAVFDGLPQAGERIRLGRSLRYFGDGYQKSKVISGRRYWRIPVMDGEFLVEESLGIEKGIGGGNIILGATTQEVALAAARRGVAAIAKLPNSITPFPGGVARSGSKVGSRYKALRASTADAYCPTLRGRVESKLDARINCVYEIVIDGADEVAISRAIVEATRAAAGEGVIAITAGNYGGKLGKFHFHLHKVLEQPN